MHHNILLVDDEPNLTSGLKNALYKEKHNIFIANSANEALSILDRESIDVLITDERMPGMSGSELLTIVHKKYPDTIRILLTGQASIEGALRAINEGDVYRFLMKPCNALDLAITIRRAIQHKTLISKTQQLLKIIKQQASFFNILEKKYPGITNIGKKLARSMKIENQESDTEELIELIDNELGKYSEYYNSFPKDNNQQDEKNKEKIEQALEHDISGKQDNVSEQANKHSGHPSDKEEPKKEKKLILLETNIQTENIDDIKDIKPLMPRTQIQELLEECSELKGLSPTVTQILKVTRHPNCSIEQVVNIIKQDHAVALKVMKLANSPVYTRGEPVDTIHKAVMRIGITQMRQVVMNISVMDQFSTPEGEKDYISTPLFWEHSISTGLIAAELTRITGGKDPQIDAAFTMGLLHDVGRIVYLSIFEDHYKNMFDMNRKLKLPLEQLESRLFLINHADAMDRILRIWNFPQELINTIALHQLSLGNMRRMAPRTLKEVAILGMANRLSHALILGSSGNLTLYPTEDFAVTLEIKPEQLNRIELEVPGQTADIKFAMLSSCNQKSWVPLRDDIKELFESPFRPLFMSAEPGLDSVRIFTKKLADVSSDEKPNIGIIHIHNIRDRVMITTRYKDAESKAEVDYPLPLIILSPNGNLQLEENAMANRHSILLPFPISFHRFIEACNKVLASVEQEIASNPISQ